MIKKDRQKILVLAAGGSGMNVIAQHFLRLESIVYGMDRDFDSGGKVRIKNCLQSMGLRVLKESDSIRELELDLIITSPAIESTHPVLQTARERNILVKVRNEYLAGIFNAGEGIGISGTSGKTTVTGMVATILNSEGEVYSVFCGDEINGFCTAKKMGNYVRGRENKYVVEIDESDKSLPLYSPYISCITSIQKDHMPVDELLKLFDAFAGNSKKIVVNMDSPLLGEIIEKFRAKVVTCSLRDKRAHYHAVIEKIDENKILYSINGSKSTLMVAGSYNVQNALLAAAISCESGMKMEKALSALSQFKGIRNRFELKKSNGSFFVLDFAHNPEKVQTSLGSAQELGLPVVYIFQPHGYGPLKFMLEEFAKVFREQFRKGDKLIVLKIYDAGGTADRTVHSKDLIQKTGIPDALYLEKHSDVLTYFKEFKKEHLTWVITGARDESLRDLNAALVHESRL